MELLNYNIFTKPCVKLYNIFHNYWSSDINLSNKYHIIAPSTLEECVKFSVNNLTYPCLVYELREGFFQVCNVNDRLYLQAYFIKPEYRKNKTEFFKYMKHILGNNWLSYQWYSNKKSVEYLVNNGCKILDTDIENNVVLLKFKRRGV